LGKKLFLTWILRQLDTVTLFVNALKSTVLRVLNTFSGLSTLSVFLILVMDFGFQLSNQNELLFSNFMFYLYFYFCGDILLRIFFDKRWFSTFVTRPLDMLIFTPALAILPTFSFFSLYLISQGALFFICLGRLSHLTKLLEWVKVKPAQLFLLGFLFVIFLGSLLLSLPVSTTLGSDISYVDALFTSFSAVCVTGLVVNDIGVDFTFFGQLVILLLIQIGGLGIISFSILLSLVTHKKISLMASKGYQDSYATFSLNETFKAILFIFKVTFFFELCGAAFLYWGWKGQFETINEGIFYAIFHSVSAFCNAGFSLFSDSLVSFGLHIPTVMVISFLIILGGLGFPVLFNLFYYQHKSYFGVRIKLQTKLALYVTAFLLIGGTFIIYLGEFNGALSGYSFQDKFLLSWFQSVTTRTAGFNTMNLSLFGGHTLLMMMIFMIIGASPGSTGGGIKTTTFGLIVVSFWSNLKASRHVNLMKRRIDEKNILEAFSLLFLAVLFISLFGYGLFYIEKGSFLPIMFEVVSAFGTVGLSLGVTPELSSGGKVLIMILMFIGRIGPLSILYALSKPKPTASYAFPKEDLVL
jgi:trk system potassium uptake protein